MDRYRIVNHLDIYLKSQRNIG